FVAHIPGVHFSTGLDERLRFGTALMAGAIILSGFLVACCLAARRSHSSHKWLPGLLLSSLALADALVTAVGRAGFGPDAALWSRYTTVSLLLWIGLTIPAAQAMLILWRW